MITIQSIHLPPNVSRDNFITSENCLCLVLDNILSQKECDEMIRKASPFLQSVSNTRDQYAQSSESKTEYHLSVIRDYEFASMVWSRLLPHVESHIAKFVKREPGVETPVSVTHRIRLLRYQDGDRFDPYYDRIVPDEQTGLESLITILIYLNNGGGKDFDGGETVFLDYKDPLNETTRAVITPQSGRVVLFEHGLYHAGLPLKQNSNEQYRNELSFKSPSSPPTKYVIRTDVMFPMRPTWAR